MKKRNICEICKLNISTEIHHITSKKYNGSNKSGNLVELCPNCHSQVHLGEIIIEGKFLTSSCLIGELELIYHMKNQPSITNSKPNCFIVK